MTLYQVNGVAELDIMKHEKTLDVDLLYIY